MAKYFSQKSVKEYTYLTSKVEGSKTIDTNKILEIACQNEELLRTNCKNENE